ncbi:MAG TPA: RidA family protein [Chloroflexi bacterium]|nr:RidA family protein [Chloroflexota bacterium]
MKQPIDSPELPKAVGPYSAAIRMDNLLFTAGQLGIDPVTNHFAGETIQEQTRQALTNLSAIITAAGFAFAEIVKTTVYLADINEFQQMNEIYAGFFTAPYPARSAFQVAALPRGAKVEIEAIAVKSLG